jgi:predicted Zn-dependent protease
MKQLQAEQQGLTFKRLEIHGRPAANTRLTEGGHIMDITLIEYSGNVYAVTGQASGNAAAQYVKSFNATARSFRALRSSERRSIEESRLRVRAARSGEKSAAVAKRTGSTWGAEALAVANGIEVGTSLRDGQLLKVAIPQAYTQRNR